MTPDPESSPTPKSYPQTFFEPPPGACQIILVRHGQSAPYVDGQPFPLVDGQGDPPLSPLGVYQAQRVCARLRHEPLTALYVTSLQRTHQTAAPLANVLGLTPRVEPNLREIHLGEGEGGRFRQMAAEGHPAVLAMRADREWGRVPGAETNDQLTDRTVAAVRRIAAAHPDEVVAAFGHGGTIGALVAFAAGVNPFIFNGTRNGAIAHLVVAGDDWVIRSFNDAAHVGPLTADAEPPT
ncbi:MAG: histidine phosphatase family protein [Actinomycetota bacterium]|nr:histidine phosphatase family protein [Actinomycetota bacterium]